MKFRGVGFRLEELRACGVRPRIEVTFLNVFVGWLKQVLLFTEDCGPDSQLSFRYVML